MRAAREAWPAPLAGAAAEAGCRVVDLPAYSPDPSPVGKSVAKFKEPLRDAAARTVDGVYEAVGAAMDRFTPDECANHFRHCGYAPATTGRTPL